MRGSYKLVLLWTITVIVTITVYSLYPEYINLIALVTSVFTIFTSIFVIYSSGKDKKYTNFLESMIDKSEREKEKHLDEITKLSSYIKNVEKIYEFEKSKAERLSKIVDNVGVALNRENISKQELIENITTPLKTIVFYKTWEDTDRDRRLFVNKVYPDMHIHCIRAGVSILPPKFVPQHLSNDEIIEWFKQEIEKRVPPDYQYNVPLITVVDLPDIKWFRRLPPSKTKGNFSYLDKIPIQELAPIDMIVEFLANKKNLSARDIIEIPNILFLVDDMFITTEDKLAITKNKKRIMEEIAKYLSVSEFNNTDLAEIDVMELTLILSKFGVKHPISVSKMIQRNAKIWKMVFNRRVSF